MIAGEFAAAIAILLSVLIIIQFWAVLPDRIPIHFGFSDQPDAWGDKVTIWLLPAVAAIMFVVLTAGSRYPHTFNYSVRITEENAQRQMRSKRCWRDRFWFG